MTHLPFVAGAYGALAAVALWLAAGARLRLSAARRRLAAIEAGAPAAGPRR